MIAITDMFEVKIMANRPLTLAFMNWLFQEMKAGRITDLRVAGGSGGEWVVKYFAPEYRAKVDQFFVEHEHLIEHQRGDHVSAKRCPLDTDGDGNCHMCVKSAWKCGGDGPVPRHPPTNEQG